MMRQYETYELSFQGADPDGSWSIVDLKAVFYLNGKRTEVKGFYAGKGIYKVRYYPTEQGICTWKLYSAIPLEGVLEGQEECVPAKEGRHGIVKADGLHFRHEDGTRYIPFGTTVYAMIHQDETLVQQTFETLENSPFNKLRFCVFPKSYDYNRNEPELFAFEKIDGKWDVNKPCFDFWDYLERNILALDKMGVEGDLILFHGYDRWGFSRFSKEEALIYLDYLLRRLSAFPNLWWSLANEYEVVQHFQKEWWYDFAQFIYENDSYGHLVSNHNFLRFWDFTDENITHCSIQDSNVIRVPELQEEYKKPVVFDECCYEGDIIHPWGNLSGFEMVNRFWTVYVMGGYCTHGETYKSKDEILWWSKGGTLKGSSSKRIAFLRSIIEELPGNLVYSESYLERAFKTGNISLPEEPAMEKLMNMIAGELKGVSEIRAQSHLDKERMILGHCGEEVYLRYFARQCACEGEMMLPQKYLYDVEVIDVWEMTRTKVLAGVCGKIIVPLPAKEGIAILARRL